MIDSASLHSRFRTNEQGTREDETMKVSAFIMVAAMACASTAEAQTTRITPRGNGGFGAGDQAPVLEELNGRSEGPQQDRSFQRFISGSVSRARVPAAGVPTP